MAFAHTANKIQHNISSLLGTRSRTHISPIPLPRPRHRPPAALPRDPRVPSTVSLPRSRLRASPLALALSPSYSAALPHATPSFHRRVSSPTPHVHTGSPPTPLHTSIRHPAWVGSRCACIPAASHRSRSLPPRGTSIRQWLRRHSD